MPSCFCFDVEANGCSFKFRRVPEINPCSLQENILILSSTSLSLLVFIFICNKYFTFF